ncbi:MAG: hypothetical protein P1U57_08320 [Oleibacter sp.]|nr:hypothetical protein [Thalassolituus sp.]
MESPLLTDAEFELFRTMIYETAGINMSPAKKALVAGRLLKRVNHYLLSTYSEYFKIVRNNTDGEFQTAIDLLITNETFFSRTKKIRLLKEPNFAAMGLRQ